jgi:predicted MFS family arabinose efflux permease
MQIVQATGDATLVFWILLAAGAASLVLIRFFLPPTPQRRATPHQADRQIMRPAHALRMPRVLAMLGMLALSMAAVDLIFVIQAAWLKADFGADAARLGQVFGMLGIAELIGSIGSTLLVDRLGKKRAVVGAFTLTALSMAALPFSNGNWPLFLMLFFLFDLCFEFAIVSSFPLASGLAPAVRGTVMALAVATIGVSRALGSLISEPLWSTWGIAANTLLGATLMLSGVLLCLVFVHETEAEPERVSG